MRIRPHLLPMLCCWTSMAVLDATPAAAEVIERFARYEATFEAAGRYANPYTDLEAEAIVQRPDGQQWSIPLFWDGASTWKLRVSPDLTGQWSYTVRSEDAGLNGMTGTFSCTDSERRGSIQPMDEFPRHFQYQNDEPMWFLGDTAWALFTDDGQEQHDRSAAEKYLRTRASQGFNVVHSMVLSEAGWGNAGGLPFEDLGSERINPGYWQEMDHRVAYANEQGIVVGLAIAWADKRKQEPFAWRRFPDLEARQRYARYIAARYGAYDVYFLVSGEWHGEVRTRPSTEPKVKKEFITIGNTLEAADAHDRMIGIHPMTQHGSVREFHEAEWMSFGDYQQNYRDLHARLLRSRQSDKPVVNSEYGYHLRDRDGDGTPDKDNSTSVKSIRHASWDIVMAGGYLVTGFGTTYFGGHRDPGPFNVDARQNDDWERQIQAIPKLLTSLEWWKLTPHDAWLRCETSRGSDGEQLGRTAPPASTYWLLAEPGRRYVAYARGLTQELSVTLGPEASGTYQARLFNPRTGEWIRMAGDRKLDDSFAFTPPDEHDWVVLLSRVSESDSG